MMNEQEEVRAGIGLDRVRHARREHDGVLSIDAEMIATSFVGSPRKPRISALLNGFYAL
jgi:hypothetical protein